MIRMWHGGIFRDDEVYTGNRCVDVIEHDVYEDGESFLEELLLFDFGYAKVLRYAFRDKKSGALEIVKVDDDDRSDFVANAMKYIDENNILEIYCECEKENEGDIIEKEREQADEGDMGLGEKEQVVVGEKEQAEGGKRKEKVANDEGDVDEGDFDDIVIEDNPVSDDGMEDNDFTDEDEEFFEARRFKKNYRKEMSMQKRADLAEKDKAVSHQSEEPHDLITPEIFPLEEDMGSDASVESLNDDREKKVKTKLYSKNIPAKDLVLEIGMRFKDTKECQEVVRGWAIANG